ncbi:thioesterase II family protein [Chitinophaga varians]|uniref:thioesterase II family protein n=1 Tax=Chitinophaga varians TaxID=2202339 RepID=UPI00165FACD3|nr:alpha/beta fold hydrolase [Chitinophaga varians]MBC9913418.1 thioesterase [Chitinophaga varians]
MEKTTVKKRVKLFCFPYAGGSSAIFHSWKAHLAPFIELHAVELAGRGRRCHEPFYRHAQEAVDDLLRQITTEIYRQPFAFFGHSLGGALVYQLAKRMKTLGLPAPVHIFFSGKGAPHIRRVEKKAYHLMSDARFAEELINLGGTPPEFFEQPGLMEFFMPLLRNDFRLAHEAGPDENIVSFDHDITVFLGKEEDFIEEQRDGWKLYTKGHCHIHYFPGGHFFLQQETAAVLELINTTLQ